ncbi:hypothetical protein JCGZ_02530 [Jatropha curcas]|uniref:Uncharacterized protein n=1 Tax=Jatropha curcas TaxID=180498 RepID=A0A067JRS9_JATCU|nr:hypothetical protein JCGZ_02530 [Jatropha curcas]
MEEEESQATRASPVIGAARERRRRRLGWERLLRRGEGEGRRRAALAQGDKGLIKPYFFATDCARPRRQRTYKALCFCDRLATDCTLGRKSVAEQKLNLALNCSTQFCDRLLNGRKSVVESVANSSQWGRKLKTKLAGVIGTRISDRYYIGRKSVTKSIAVWSQIRRWIFNLPIIAAGRNIIAILRPMCVGRKNQS